MPFPWMMYRKGPGLALPRGQSVSCQVAHDEAEQKSAIAAGWFPSVPEALAGKLDAPPAPVAEKPAEPMAPAVGIVLADAPEVDESPRRGPGRPRR